LLSEHIKLVAAFDHRHVFVDPDPHPAISFAERRRMFALPRSSWADYDPTLISVGGGVWPRSAKSVPVSPQARTALGIDAGVTALSPDELISAILAAAMSNLSAALNSLSSATIVDFYARWRPLAGEPRRVRLSRLATLIWGVALFGLAIVTRHGGRVLEVGLSIASVAYGSLLGVFLLGVLTQRANERGAMVGMLFGFLFNLYLWRFTRVPFTWYVTLGSIVTFLVGYAMSAVLPANPTHRPATHPGEPHCN